MCKMLNASADRFRQRYTRVNEYETQNRLPEKWPAKCNLFNEITLLYATNLETTGFDSYLLVRGLYLTL